ncbi:MAG TPA: glycerate kinase [Verrucomicrobiae bacterium]|nr:glycerate kinase [Verrucomicrobiae bacterium]
MKIIVALDKFKGSLTAPRACDIVRDALLSVRPEWHVVTKPMADGGDGTDEVLLATLGGEWISLPVMGPLPRMSCTARYAWLPKEAMAVIAMANASGLILLKSEQHNPLVTTTYGTGELIRAATERGAKHIWLAVGGSATVDGGVGAAMAFGWRFLDAQGTSVGFGGGELERIARIERPSKLLVPVVEVLCDVDNPLCGEHGAARVFGPQKGATPAMVERLDAGLQHLGRVAQEQLGKDIVTIPGAGAAGGLAGGALAFMDARLTQGVETVIHANGMDVELADADWVITGEGRFDGQSLRGKVVSGVAKLAAKHGAKVGVLAGSVHVLEEIYQREGIEVALSTMKRGMELDEALERAEELLASAARELAARIVD